MIILVGNKKSGKSTFSKVFTKVVEKKLQAKSGKNIGKTLSTPNSGSVSTVSIRSVTEFYIDCYSTAFAHLPEYKKSSDKLKQYWTCSVLDKICYTFGITQSDIDERQVPPGSLLCKCTYSFAYPVKVLLSMILKVDLLLLLGEDSESYKKREKIGFREHAVKLADIFKSISKDFWAEVLKYSIHVGSNLDKHTLITDLRFKPELTALQPIMGVATYEKPIHFIYIHRANKSRVLEYDISDILDEIRSAVIDKPGKIKFHVVPNTGTYRQYKTAIKGKLSELLLNQ